MSIILPPLPEPVYTYDEDGNKVFYEKASLVRARDIEVARLVLKGVAAEIRKWGDESRAAKDEHVALFCQITAASVEKLEVRHHE